MDGCGAIGHRRILKRMVISFRAVVCRIIAIWSIGRARFCHKLHMPNGRDVENASPRRKKRFAYVLLALCWPRFCMLHAAAPIQWFWTCLSAIIALNFNLRRLRSFHRIFGQCSPHSDLASVDATPDWIMNEVNSVFAQNSFQFHRRQAVQSIVNFSIRSNSSWS